MMMVESAPLRWLLVLVFAGVGGWFLLRGVRPGTGLKVTDRVSHVAHALMAVAMVAMMWPMG